MSSIQQLLSPIVSLSSSPKTLLLPVSNDQRKSSSLVSVHYDYDRERGRRVAISGRRKNKMAVFVSNKEDTEVSINTAEAAAPADPQLLEYISQIKRVLDLLKRNRDMTFNEVKLTIMIEDPRDVERKRLLGIDDETAPTRDDLATTLEEVNKGEIPEDRVALQLLAEELMQWPNLEVEIERKKGRGKSLYAIATDTGIDPKEAAKRLNIDWDEAAEITEDDDSDDADVPPAVGYGALYLVTAFPVIIGVSVVLILFYNSLQ